MTWRIIAGIIGGGIFGLLIGFMWGWAARSHSIVKAGYTVLTLAGKLYVLKTPGLARSSGVGEEAEEQDGGD